MLAPEFFVSSLQFLKLDFRVLSLFNFALDKVLEIHTISAIWREYKLVLL